MSSSVRPVFIAATSRTPFGTFQGSLASVTAPQLGAAAISNLVAKVSIISFEKHASLIFRRKFQQIA